jgi:MFS family permease
MTDTPRMTQRERRATLALASVFALRMLGLFLILPVFAIHARGLPGADATLVGVAVGIYGLTQGLLQIPFGVASDRWGRKPVIVFGLAVFALGSFVAAVATDLAWIIAGRALQGAGAVSAAVTAMIADSTRESHRTRAMALVGASIGGTFALSLVVAPMLYPLAGVRGLFALTGVLVVAAIAVVIWVVPPVPTTVHEDAPAATWRGVLADAELIRLNVGIFVLHAVLMGVFVVLPPRLVELGLPLAQHAWVYLATMLVSFALMLPPILAAERHGRVRWLMTGSIALLLASVAALAFSAASLAWLLVSLLVFFVAFNILEAAVPSLASRVAPRGAKGMALGVYNTSQSLGLFAGGPLAGWLLSHFGMRGVFLGAAVAVAAWLAVAFGMREPGRRAATAATVAADEAI